jgi:hypothetical protein
VTLLISVQAIRYMSLLPPRFDAHADAGPKAADPIGEKPKKQN